MAKKVTTLFIRDNSVNIAVFDGLKIAKWATHPLEAELVTQGFIKDEAKVTASIKEMLKENGIHAGKVIAGLSGASTLYRIITLPEIPDALLAEAVKREAKRVLPISLDDVYLSYQAVPSVSRGERRLFISAYPRNTTDAMVRTLRAAGMDPYLMDLAPLALARIPNEPRCLIVSTREHQADIIVVDERLPQLIRVLTLPTEANTMSERLPAISEELNRTVVFYNSSHVEKPLNQAVPVFVSGELAEVPDQWPQLVGRLNFPVSVLPFPIEIPPDFPAYDFIINMGLALKEFTSERPGDNFSTINFNVLPEIYHPKRVSLSWVLIPAVGIIGVAILAYLGFLVYRGSADIKQLKAELEKSEPPITQQTQKIKSLKDEINKVTPQIAPVNSQIAQVNATTAVFNTQKASLETSRTNADTYIKDRVIGFLPFNKEILSLVSVNYTPDVITVSGTAVDEDDIFQYASKIRSSGGISSTIISSISWDEGAKKYTFNLLIKE
jgi:type IV pilus assembly protein PilM